jgi:hypothetical protein
MELRPEDEKDEGEGMGSEVGYGSREGGKEVRRDGRGFVLRSDGSCCVDAAALVEVESERGKEIGPAPSR